MIPVVPAKVPSNFMEWLAMLICYLGSAVCIA